MIRPSTLSPRLAELGGRLLVETIAQLKAGTLVPQPQDRSQATLAPLLKKEDGVIDWALPATALANRVRGLSPWPGAYTTTNGGDRWTIWRALALPGPVTKPPGMIVAVTKKGDSCCHWGGVLAVMEFSRPIAVEWLYRNTWQAIRRCRVAIEASSYQNRRCFHRWH